MERQQLEELVREIYATRVHGHTEKLMDWMAEDASFVLAGRGQPRSR